MMGIGSIIGLIVAVGGILIGQFIEGGHVSSLIQGSAFCIVLSGTLGAVILQAGWGKFCASARMIGWIVVPAIRDTEDARAKILEWSNLSRREGVLKLEDRLDDAPDGFCRLGLRLIVDGNNAIKVSDVLNLQIETVETRYREQVKVWEAAGGYAPTIGILGAVLGLIHVMENLSDPTKLGPGIAVAFVATIYGVGLANLFFLPIANNLKSVCARRVRELEMLTDGFVGIASADNPQAINDRMKNYL